MLAELIDEIMQVRLEWRMKKRVESVDFSVCVTHDVAPIVEKVLGRKGKDLRDEEFAGFVEKWGLGLGEGVVWKERRSVLLRRAKKKEGLSIAEGYTDFMTS
jgi:hypothetical protein